MANFPTHIAAGTVVSGALATLTLAADVVAPENLIAITMAGVLGSVLPDIDLENSRASRIMFGGLAIFFSFVVLFAFAQKFSIAELWILWFGTLLIVRYGLHEIFHRISVHRGVWHSLLAAAFVSATTAVVFYHVLQRHEGVAWLAAGFMFIGYIVHLVLDEMYSVDILDRRLKVSFGTALKWIDGKRPSHNVAMAVAIVAMLFMTPSTKTFVDGISSRNLWAGLHERMLPDNNVWFGGVFQNAEKLVAGPARNEQTSKSDIETGSIPPNE
ncbi:MAG: metal-dependent hydrolase [Hyphomicrobiaceae bacterium]